MIRIPCPHCGPRDSLEFRHAGTPRPRPEPASTTPQEWRRFLYEKDNLADRVTETWYHSFGCRRFFTVTRHTVTNEFVAPAADGPAGGADAGATGAPTGTGGAA